MKALMELLGKLPFNNFKTYLANLVTLLGVAIELFPNIPYLSDANGYLIALAGILGVQLGAMHSKYKFKNKIL